MLNKSFTNSGVNYVVLQARNSDGTFHIQGKGVETNRNYGVAENISEENFPEDFIDWMDELDYIYPSLAGTDKKYFRLQAKLMSNSLHIQIPGPENNRKYGMAFEIAQENLPEVTAFVKAELGK